MPRHHLWAALPLCVALQLTNLANRWRAGSEGREREAGVCNNHRDNHPGSCVSLVVLPWQVTSCAFSRRQKVALSCSVLCLLAHSGYTVNICQVNECDFPIIKGSCCVSLCPEVLSMLPQTDQGPAQGWVVINLLSSWVSTLPASFPTGQGLAPDRWALTGSPKYVVTWILFPGT